MTSTVTFSNHTPLHSLSLLYQSMSIEYVHCEGMHLIQRRKENSSVQIDISFCFSSHFLTVSRQALSFQSFISFNKSIHSIICCLDFIMAMSRVDQSLLDEINNEICCCHSLLKHLIFIS